MYKKWPTGASSAAPMTPLRRGAQRRSSQLHLERPSREGDDLLVLNFLLLIRSEFLADGTVDTRSDELLRGSVEDEAAVVGHLDVAAVQSTDLLARADHERAVDALLRHLASAVWEGEKKKRKRRDSGNNDSRR